MAANTDFPGSLAAALLEISTTVSQIFTLKEPRLDTAKRLDLNKKTQLLTFCGFLGTNIRTNEEVAIKLVSALIPGQCPNFKRSWDNFTAFFRAFKFAQFTSIIKFQP